MAAFAPISRRIRHVKRYGRLLEVLARYGFADLAQTIGMDTLVDRGREILGTTPRRPQSEMTAQERVRIVLEELGPTFVKMGQILSTREDLIPAAWADEFRKLQNNVPGVDYSTVRATIEAEFPGSYRQLFKSIQKRPMAAASMAQVHRARLRDGTRIVLKVLRPGIREVIETDMEILHTIAGIAEPHATNLGFSPTEVVGEFSKELEKEVDFKHEARSTERLGRFFADDPGVVFPKVYWQATTRSVLALEEMQGIVLSDLKDGEIDAEDRRRLVENGAKAVFRQCLEFGFFHADPHPGNLIALSGGRMAFIDCGMTGQLDDRTTQQLADLVEGVVDGDLDRVIAVVGAVADVEAVKLEERSLRADVNAIVAQFQNTPLDRLSLGPLLEQFFAALRRHRIRCPADLMLLIKALTTIEAVGRELDPTFELAGFVRPYVERLVQKRYSMTAVRSRLKRSLMQYAEMAEELPRELRPLIKSLRRNRLSVNIEHHGLERLTRTVEHASRNISFALIIAAMFVGSSILVLAARNPGMGALTTMGAVGFATSAVLVVLMMVSNRRSRGD